MSDYNGDEEQLLEYETENEADEELHLVDARSLDPVPVCVKEPVVTVPTVPQHATCYTLRLDTDEDRFVELLPADPLRVRAIVIVHDAPVVICDSRAQANSDANQAAGVPAPSGAYVPASPVASTRLPDLHATCQFFVAATSGDPARVSVIVERRTP